MDGAIEDGASAEGRLLITVNNSIILWTGNSDECQDRVLIISEI